MTFAAVAVRRRRWFDPGDIAFRFESQDEGPGPVLLTFEQAQDIVDGLAAFGVVARP